MIARTDGLMQSAASSGQATEQRQLSAVARWQLGWVERVCVDDWLSTDLMLQCGQRCLLQSWQNRSLRSCSQWEQTGVVEVESDASIAADDMTRWKRVSTQLRHEV